MGWFSGLRRSLFGDERPAERAAKKAAQDAETARQQAEQQSLATAKQQAEYQKAMIGMQRESQNLEANNKADLGTDLSVNVIAGGTADQSADAIFKKKKQAAPGMAAQLGINV